MDYFFFFVRVSPLEETHISSLFLHILPQANFSGNIYACKIFLRNTKTTIFTLRIFLLSHQLSTLCYERYYDYCR
jgi:hypothetical protein